MEINLEIKYDELNQDGTREADKIWKTLFEMYPESLWRRNGDGHQILI